MNTLTKKRPLFVVAICALAGLALGFLVGRLDLLVAGALMVAVLGGLLIFWQPLYGLLILAASTTALSYRGHLPGLGIDSIHAPDLLLGALVAATFLQVFYNRKPLVTTPITLPLLLFVTAGIISHYVGHLVKGVDFYGSLKEFKVVLYYLPALLLPQLVEDRKDLNFLVRGLLVVGGLIAVYVAFLAITQSGGGGSSQSTYYSISSKTGGSEKMLVLWCVCVLVTLLVYDRIRITYLVVLALTLSYFVLMFHRHMYMLLALIGGFGLIMLVRRGRTKWVRMLGILGVILLLSGAVLTWGPPELRRYAHLTVERAVSIKGIEATSTVQVRQLENQYAWEQITRHPLIGLGFYTPYRPNIYGPDDRLQWFLHNGYLWILLKMGLMGFLPFVWLLTRFFKRGFRHLKATNDPLLKATVTGSLIFMATTLPANMVAAYFMQDWGVIAMALAFGLNETVYRLYAKTPTPPPS